MTNVAAYQGAFLPDDEARKAQIKTIITKATNDQIDFLCLPEGFLTGYYAEEHVARLHSLEVNSLAFNEWLELFSQSETTYIVGFNELADGRLYDSAAIIEKGKLLGIQRKHFLYHAYFSAATTFSVYRSKGISFGVTICLDTNYFEPARLLALQGATILFSPMCNKVSPSHPFAKRPPYYSHFVARSFENRCWLVAADWVYPSDGTTICPGHSVIYDPDGKEMARSQEMREEVIQVSIDQTRLFPEKGRRVSGSPHLNQQLAQFNQL